jgi:hypothetical protein
MSGARSAFARLHVPVIASFIMLVFFSGYYFLYFRSQQAYFTEHHFRLLSLLTHQFQSKTDILLQVLNNAQATTDRTAFSLYVRYLRPVSCLPFEDRGSVAKGQIGNGAVVSTTLVISPGNLRFTSAGSSSAPFCATSSLKDLLATIIPADAEGSEGAFDSIVLTGKDGSVLFQAPESANRISRLGPFPAPGNIESNNLLSVNYGGTDYDVFSQPLQITVQAGGSGATYTRDRAESLTLYGLVRHSSFVSRCLAIPYKYILALISFLLLALFSYPFLKISSMQRQERFLARDGLALIVFTFLGTGLLTFLLLGLYYDNRALHEEAHANLKDLADLVESNLTGEIRHLAKQLDALNGSGWAAADTKSSAQGRQPGAGGSGPRRAGEQASECSAQARTYILADKDLGRGLDPHFGFAFWTDEQGCQRIKWTTRRETTRALNVAGRDWYLEYQSHPLPFQLRTKEQACAVLFGLQPNFSITTGEQEVILWIKRRGGQALQPFAGTKLRSLMSATLPPGFGFAVITPEGDVLFHSERTRSQTENLFEEC